MYQMLGDSGEGDAGGAHGGFGNGRGDHRAKAPALASFGGDVQLAQRVAGCFRAGAPGHRRKTGGTMQDGAAGVWRVFKVIGGERRADGFGAFRQQPAVADHRQRDAARTGKKIQAQFGADSGRVAGSDDDGNFHSSGSLRLRAAPENA